MTKAPEASPIAGHGPGAKSDDEEPPRGRRLLGLSLAALGVVYGDIGTSPLYAVRECFHGEHAIPPTAENVLGVLSLIFWSLIVVISIKYLAYVLRADNHGEGGILALMALAAPHDPKRAPRAGITILVGLFGAALLYGDGMITPAISVLSAAEGLEIATDAMATYVVPLTCVILVGLFLFQQRGTAGVGAAFGPATLVWFVVLAVLGVAQIARNPETLAALNPVHGAGFLMHNGLHGLLVLGAVFLVVTGGEALYADMGHFGARPIRLTWFALVLPALLLNYLGQGALLLRDPGAASNPFYRMAPGWALVPMVLLATVATIIASQAIISGAFSLTRQAVMLGYWPRVAILHTSEKEVGQIYVPSINWILMLSTIALVVAFGSSTRLAAAYGIAVTSTMVITTLLAFIVARRRWGWGLPATLALTGVFLVIDLAFFVANLFKFTDGGWFPILVAVAVFTVMTTWRKGRQHLGRHAADKWMPLEKFFEELDASDATRVPGTAVFLTGNPTGVPPALVHNLRLNHVVHERVVLLTITTEEVPRVRYSQRVEVEELERGFYRVIARYGFTESPDVLDLLARDDTPTPDLDETTFVLGRETILPQGDTGMSRWRSRLFAFLSRNALGATRFFNVPPARVLEVGAQVEL